MSCPLRCGGLRQLVVCVQVPLLVVSYAKPGTEEELIKEGKLGVQTFPGPLKYPYMHSFLSTFAGMLG